MKTKVIAFSLALAFVVASAHGLPPPARRFQILVLVAVRR
jgi:hypothetical protein